MKEALQNIAVSAIVYTDAFPVMATHPTLSPYVVLGHPPKKDPTIEPIPSPENRAAQTGVFYKIAVDYGRKIFVVCDMFCKDHQCYRSKQNKYLSKVCHTACERCSVLEHFHEIEFRNREEALYRYCFEILCQRCEIDKLKRFDIGSVSDKSTYNCCRISAITPNDKGDKTQCFVAF